MTIEAKSDVDRNREMGQHKREAFHSILSPFPSERDAIDSATQPIYFRDLTLDQVVTAVTDGRDAYKLQTFFHTPLNDLDTVAYRHEVFRDLEDATIVETLEDFAEAMQEVRQHVDLSETLRHRESKHYCLLDAVAVYCDAVTALNEALNDFDLGSRGLASLRSFLSNYTASPIFSNLTDKIKTLRDDLDTIRYETLIRGSSVTVRKYADEANYSAEVERSLKKFKQGAVKDYRVTFAETSQLNHVEEAILSRVALLYPEIFGQLARFSEHHVDFVDPTISAFDREVQFYLSWVEHMAWLSEHGLSFCYPVLSRDKSVRSSHGFDVALAGKLANEGTPLVTNDFHLDSVERIIVVSGPNQGGKTTFARAFGQLHYLASLGLPVPGTEARLFLFDQMFAHFEREESISNLRSKLEDDLVRIHDILEQATPESIILLNEIFNSTTLDDQIFLSTKVFERIMELDALCVCVSFIDELATLSETTVSMVSTVNPVQPAERTLKILRRPADGLAFAMSLAEKHGVTYARLQERLTR